MLLTFKSNSLIVENIFLDKSTPEQSLFLKVEEYVGEIGPSFTVGEGVLNKEKWE
jgi:hypothetical protein